MKKTSEDIIKLKLEIFLLRYSFAYNEELLNFVKDNFFTCINEDAPDILMQIYTELQIKHKNNGFYEEHVKKIKENFDIRGNILDVASGVIPAFGNLVAKEQLKIGSGTVTLCDPALGIRKSKYPNMKLMKENFYANCDVSKYDLITGILPCDATDEIIKAACKNNKNFYIAMCGCVHYDGYPYIYMTPEHYQYCIISMAEKYLKEYDNGKLVVEKLDDRFSIDYPIIYNKKS